MKSKAAIGGLSKSWLLLGAAALFSGMVSPALAQTQTEEEEVVVTGYRASLESSTEAKREATGFVDSVFAEDIGQMPDLNIAESLQRVPGVLIAREVNGEGLNIAIRGLGTNFTKTVLNGNAIAVASSGSVDTQNVNRELDLDLFPTELFTRLDVSKTLSAHDLEGGVSGLVNMRSARPFDYDENQVTYTFQGSYGEHSEDWSPRGALIASGRWNVGQGGEVGALIGYAGVRNHSTTLGYETIGVTNSSLTYNHAGVAPPAPVAPGAGVTLGTSICGTVVQNPLPAPQNPPASQVGCFNGSGGNGFRWADLVPASADPLPGIATGDPVTAAMLLSLNPGLTIQQISEALLPRLGRPAYFDGDRDRDSGLISLQWAPNNNLEFYLDIMGSQATREFNRLDLMFEVRNSNFMLPTAMQVDANNVVTSGTFYNSRLFLEARPYTEEVDFININPGLHIQFSSTLGLDFQLNHSESNFFREQPTIGLTISGVTLDYDNTGGDIPTFNYAVDPNNPSAGWQWLRVNLQNERRETETEGAHADFTWGDSDFNLRFGAAWDNISRTITALDNTNAWSNFICGGGLPPPPPGGAAAPCNGGAGSAIETADIPDFLMPSAAGFVTPLYDQIFAISNYQQFFDNAPIAQGAATGARSGAIEEDTIGYYLEANGDFDLAGRRLRYNAGGRYVMTDQAITGPVFVNGIFSNFNTNRSDYTELLPAANAVYELTDNVQLRLSASRTLTRPNPNDMLPSINFTDPSAQNATLGNAGLEPFISENIDIGGEWYTGGEGYFGVAYFQKTIEGFTQNRTTIVPFLSLGIPYASLTPTQQTAIDNRGGPNVATVNLTTPINASGDLEIRGWELNWVQPLDFLLEGLGFTANYTDIDQEGSGAAPAIATNISPITYNFTAYYERGGFSGRVSYTWNDIQQQTTGPQDGFSASGSQAQAGHRFTEARGQLDAAFRYTFEDFPTRPQLTLDLININGETRREYQGFENLAYKFYDPGYSILLGVRGTY